MFLGNSYISSLFDSYFLVFSLAISCTFKLILLIYAFFMEKYLPGLYLMEKYCLSNSLNSLCRVCPCSSALINLNVLNFSLRIKKGKIRLRVRTYIFLVILGSGNKTGYISKNFSHSLAHSSVCFSVGVLLNKRKRIFAIYLKHCENFFVFQDTH